MEVFISMICIYFEMVYLEKRTILIALIYFFLLAVSDKPKN